MHLKTQLWFGGKRSLPPKKALLQGALLLVPDLKPVTLAARVSAGIIPAGTMPGSGSGNRRSSVRCRYTLPLKVFPCRSPLLPPCPFPDTVMSDHHAMRQRTFSSSSSPSTSPLLPSRVCIIRSFLYTRNPGLAPLPRTSGRRSCENPVNHPPVEPRMHRPRAFYRTPAATSPVSVTGDAAPVSPVNPVHGAGRTFVSS